MTDDPWILFGAVLFTACAVAALKQWRTASVDESFRGIPTRSALPLAVGFAFASDSAVFLPTDEGTLRGVLVIIVVAVFLGCCLLALTTGFLRWPKWAIPPKLLDPTKVTHDLGVNYADREMADGDPYYIGICSCGWSGDIFPDQASADAQAREHVPGVNPPLRRTGETG